MAGWNGSGSFSISFPDFVAGTPIVSTQVDTNNSDFVTGLMHCLTVNGETVPTANLPMVTFKHTGVGNASARDQYAAAGQVQDSAFHWVNAAGVTGTADAILLAPSPAITAYAEGQVFRFRAEATSTSATPTVNVSSVGAKTIQKDGGALAVGDIVNTRWYEIFYDGTNFQLRNISLAAAAGATALLASANTFTASQTIQSTDAGAAIGPTLILDRDSASPADGDILGGILFRGEDESGGDDDYATIQGEIVDATGGTEDGRIGFLTKIAGTDAARAYVGAGIYTASVTGGDQGAGTVNAAGVYEAGVQLKPFVSDTAQNAASTALDFTSIPSWVKRIHVTFSAFSTNGTSIVIVQIGDSGGIEASGYSGSSVELDASPAAAAYGGSGFEIAAANTAARTWHGVLTMVRHNTGNTWAASGTFGDSASGTAGVTGGSKALSATLDRVRVTTVSGADTLDAGSINIHYD